MLSHMTASCQYQPSAQAAHSSAALRAASEMLHSCYVALLSYVLFEGVMAGLSQYDYDLLVIGSGPAGHRAAIQGAKLDKRVAIIEKRTVIGGVCVNTGTIPSKTLREAALRLSGYRERGIYGASYSVKQHITMRD